MILCDIGNYKVDFFNDGRIWSMTHREFCSYKSKEKIYYISVNENISNRLKNISNFINVESYFKFDTIYQGIGIDRVAACTVINDGMIVDAGSAITIDIMSNSLHLGGFILPGLSAYKKCYSSISDRLAVGLKPNIDLDALPQKTEDAVSYGIIKPILMILEESRKDKMIYFTGGDGKFFSKYFENSIYDKTLIFRGIKKVLKEKKLC